MKHELKKVLKIADEVMTCCMYKYDPEKATFTAKQTDDGYELDFQFETVTISDEDVAGLREKLSAERNPELEDYYWQLAGEVENSSELALVALMSDLAEVCYDGRLLAIRLSRKTASV
jgi:hypothetical protein